jgi:hypothetical protein
MGLGKLCMYMYYEYGGRVCAGKRSESLIIIYRRRSEAWLFPGSSAPP